MQQIFRTIQRMIEITDPRLILVVLIALIIFTSSSSVWLSNAAAPNPTPLPARVEISAVSTPTPFPADYLRNEEQTIGPTVAASILVLVVVAAVLSRMLRKPTQ